MKAKLLVIHDRRDMKVPIRDGEALVKAWPGARLMATEGFGHHKILKDTPVIEQAVAFLAGATDSASASETRIQSGFDVI